MIQSDGWHATSLHNTFCDWHWWHVEKVGPSVLWNSCTVTYGRLIVLSLVKGNRRGMFALYQKGVGCSGRVSVQTGHRSLSLRVTWFLLPFHSKSACMLRTILKLLRLSKDSFLNIKKNVILTRVPQNVSQVFHSAAVSPSSTSADLQIYSRSSC